MDKVELRSRLKPWLLAVAAALPFQLLYLFDYIIYGSSATGFSMIEMPYYAANGRAYFDHGNGFLHPNPYDPNSPNIYFQLSTWVIGASNKVTGIDPGVGMALLGFIFAVLAARVTYSLVALRLTESKYTTLAYFVVMFAGGLFTVRALIEMLIGTAPNQTTQDGLLTAFEPAYGWWTLNWGRNLVLTTEAMYHWLMSLAWLSFLRDQWHRGVLITAIVCLSHPWTAIVAIGILGAWAIAKWWRFHLKPDLLSIATIVIMVATFLWYYAIFLPSFPSHHWIVTTWKDLYIIKWSALILSLMLPALLALAYLRQRERTQFTIQDLFLLVTFAVPFLLTKHDMFGISIQPLHFNRGYPWLALTLFALPALPFVIERVRKWGILAVASMILIACSDNIGFFFSEYFARSGDKEHDVSISLDRDIHALFDYADSAALRGTCITPDLNATYAIATYTSMSPYVGHRYLTPDWQIKVDRWDAFLAGRNPSLFGSLDYMILHDTSRVSTTGLNRIQRKGLYTLWSIAR